MDEVTLRVVGSTTGNDLSALFLGLLDQTGDLVESDVVDDRTGEVGEVGEGTNLDLVDLLNKLRLESTLPKRSGNVDTAKSGTLLSRVLETSSDGLNDTRLDVGRRVVQVEVLTTGLSDKSWVTLVQVDVVSNSAPQGLEDLSGSSEVETSKVLVVDTLADNLRWVSGDELDDRWWDTGLEEDLVGDVRSKGGSWGWLPDDDVSDNGRGEDEVTTDSGEVEWGNGEDETFESTVFSSVPDTGRVAWGLNSVHVLDVLDTESQEISELGSRVNLGLPSVLALTEHGGGHKFVPVLAGDEVGSLEEDGGTVGPWELLPSVLGGKSVLDGALDHLGSGSVVRGEVVGVVMGHGLLLEVTSLDLDMSAKCHLRESCPPGL